MLSNDEVRAVNEIWQAHGGSLPSLIVNMLKSNRDTDLYIKVNAAIIFSAITLQREGSLGDFQKQQLVQTLIALREPVGRFAEYALYRVRRVYALNCLFEDYLQK